MMTLIYLKPSDTRSSIYYFNVYMKYVLTILLTHIEIATAALARTLRLEWVTKECNFFSKGTGEMEVAIASSAFSASSHTNRLS